MRMRSCASCMQQGALLKLTGARCCAKRTSITLQINIDLWACTEVPVRGGRVPAAAAEGLEHMKLAAIWTPALRHAAAQHRGALHVRRAQARVQVVCFDERLGAARHAAHTRAVT